MSISYEEIKNQAKTACQELVETAKLHSGQILVVGCSSSEIMGQRIGKASDINAAEAVYEGIMEVLAPRGIYLAAQCCEHLNRAVILENEALPPWYDIAVSYTHLRAHETGRNLVCRLLLEKKKK